LHRELFRLFLHISLCSVVCMSVVCLSVVCHIRAPCSNSSADLHAIWQVHLRGPVTHFARRGSLTPKEKGDLGVNPQPVAANPPVFMLPPGEYKRGLGWTCHSDSVFCQITLVFVAILFANSSSPLDAGSADGAREKRLTGCYLLIAYYTTSNMRATHICPFVRISKFCY